MGRSISAAALAGAMALLAAASAAGQSKTLTVASYGGSWEQQMRKDVIPAFEQKHGVKVEYVAGNSTDTLAKLQAQKGNQVIDVAIVDDGPMYQAIQLGFCAKIDGLDKSQLYPAALFKDDKAVAVGQTGTGFMHLAPMVGLECPMRPERGQIVVTERLRPFLRHPVVTLRQTDEGTVMIGDSKEERTDPAGLTLGVSATEAERAVRMRSRQASRCG